MRPGRGWRRWTLVPALAWALMAGAASPVRAAEPPVSIENVHVGFPIQGQDVYEVGAWTPVWVDLKAGPAGFQGLLEVLVPDNDGTPTSVHRGVAVPAGQMATFAAYTRPGRSAAEFTVQVYAEGERRPTASKDVKPGGDALPPGQSLLLTFGKAAGIEDVPTATGLGADPNSPNGQSSSVAVASVRVPEGVPGQWYGYGAADVVVLNSNDRAAVDALDGLKGEALMEWVHQGGHLVVALGEGWQALAGGPLGALLPARPKGRLQLTDPGALEAFADSKIPLIAGGARMTVTQLEPVEALGGRALDVSVPSPLVVRGHYGFGRVTVVGLDVDRKPFSDWPDRKDFWVRVLDLRRQAYDSVAAAAGTAPVAFRQSSVLDLSGYLHTKLEQFAGIKLVPFAYVAGFVFLYILLIGPGDYFFLKKVVRRMELTWITFPLIVATVSLLAYFSAYAIKGTELKLNKVDALDIDQTGKRPQARGTTWFTLFSPKDRDYDVAIAPLPLDADPAAPAPASPSRSEVLLSFFGAPEGPFGMNARGGLSLATRPYAYGPADTPRTLEGVRVPIWSTKSFLGRWSGAIAPAVATELQHAGPDRLSGTVTNLLPHRTLRGAIPGHGAMLIYGKQYYDLGELKPNQVVPVGELTPLILSSEVDRIRDNKLPGYVNQAPRYDQPMSNATPAELVFEAMFADSSGTGGARVVNQPLRYLDLTGQLALDRPMLVAAVDGPAAALDLGEGAPTPKSDQTTVLRVILPPPAAE